MKSTGAFVVLALLFAAPSHGQDCTTQVNQADTDVLSIDDTTELFVRQQLEYAVDKRAKAKFDGVKTLNGTFLCATATPSASYPLGQIAGLPEAVSGQAQCAYYCQTYSGCISFNYLRKPLADGTQCQLFTSRVTTCSTDPTCDHYEISGQHLSCRTPAGFTYFPITQAYYKVIWQPMTWAEAQDYCLSLNPFSHLAVFRSMAEFKGLIAILKTYPAADVWKCSTNASYSYDWSGWWVAKRKMNDDAVDYNACKAAPAVQALNTDRTKVLVEQPWESQMYLAGQPDCSTAFKTAFTYQMCMNIPVNHLYQLSDIMCDYKMCAVCQLDTN